jgi:uncharacterized protein YcgI (DUF1989 family)
MPRTLDLRFNQQQLELIDRALTQGYAANRADLVRRAISELGRPKPPRPAGAPPPRPAVPADLPQTRQLVSEHVMQPGTGKALEVRKGQILRIEQIAGPQCVDFNCFNLHDYKEAMHAGRIRAVHGLKPTAGDFVWSAPPRERAMMFILADTVGANDVLFSRCSAYLYESAYGFAAHTNCHDIQAEAQREYGLTPDDVHDSLNFFMATGVEGDRAVIKRLDAKVGDYVELLALIDVLAVPNVCGNDVGRTSNFELKPIKLSVLTATADDWGKVPLLVEYPTNRRNPATFAQPNIRAERALTRDPAFVAHFTNVPLKSETVSVDLGDDAIATLSSSPLTRYYGADLAALARDMVLSWWEETFTANLPGTND